MQKNQKLTSIYVKSFEEYQNDGKNLFEIIEQYAPELKNNLDNMEVSFNENDEFVLKDNNDKTILCVHNDNVFIGNDLKIINGVLHGVERNLTAEDNENRYLNQEQNDIIGIKESINNNIKNIYSKIKQYNNNPATRIKLTRAKQNTFILSTKKIFETLLQRANRPKIEQEICDLIKDADKLFINVWNRTTMQSKIELYEQEKNLLQEIKNNNIALTQKISKAINDRISVINNDMKRLENDNKDIIKSKNNWIDNVRQSFIKNKKNYNIIEDIMRKNRLTFDACKFKSSGVFNKDFWIEKEEIINYGKPIQKQTKILLYISPDGRVYTGNNIKLERHTFSPNKVSNFDATYQTNYIQLNKNNNVILNSKNNNISMQSDISSKMDEQLMQDIKKIKMITNEVQKDFKKQWENTKNEFQLVADTYDKLNNGFKKLNDSNNKQNKENTKITKNNNIKVQNQNSGVLKKIRRYFKDAQNRELNYKRRRKEIHQRVKLNLANYNSAKLCNQNNISK